MNIQKLDELKSLYESELKEKVKNNYTPFVIKISECYDGKNGVLFVGKAENMEDKENTTIENAFNKVFKGMNTVTEKPSGKASKSAYSRVIHQLAKYLKNTQGIHSFARTNLYKLSTTKTDVFGSKYETAFVDIFKKEIELLQPKYVIMLTSGLEKTFLDTFGKKQLLQEIELKYKNKGNQSKNIKCIKFEGLNSIFITAVHPQGKPEKELVNVIISLINNTEKI